MARSYRPVLVVFVLVTCLLLRGLWEWNLLQTSFYNYNTLEQEWKQDEKLNSLLQKTTTGSITSQKNQWASSIAPAAPTTHHEQNNKPSSHQSTPQPITPNNSSSPDSTDFSVITSASTLGFIELAAIRSWIIGAGATIVFFCVNSPTQAHEFLTAKEPRQSPLHHRLVILNNPEPQSTLSGKVLVSSLINYAETFANTSWILLINSDIVLEPRFGVVPSLLNHTLAATGMRTNCLLSRIHLSEERLLNIIDMPSLESISRFCLPTAASQADYFLFRKGFWKRLFELNHLDASNGTRFWYGVGYWDNSFIHVARSALVDLTPIMLSSHISVPAMEGNPEMGIRAFKTTIYDKLGLKQDSLGRGWKGTLNVNDAKAIQTELKSSNPKPEYKDLLHNLGLRCANNHRVPNAHCFIKGSIRYVSYQLCPDGTIQAMNFLAVKQAYENQIIGFILNQTYHGHVSKLVRDVDDDDSARLAQLLGCHGNQAVWRDEVWNSTAIGPSLKVNRGISGSMPVWVN